MLLYAHTITPRLKYILHWFQEHYLEEPMELTDSLERFQLHPGARINYSAQRISDTECWIEPSALLFENEIRQISPEVSSNGTFPIFFCGQGDMGFDIFASSFYLISRYEEYLPSSPDAYGRYDHRHSLAFQQGFLLRPLADEWMIQFCRCLRSYFPEIRFRSLQYQHLATYDIDESYAYRYKPGWLQFVGLTRDLALGRWDWVRDRVRTLFGSQKDPYDSYAFIQALHTSSIVRPICFFPMTTQKNGYDKNLSPSHSAQTDLIRSVSTWCDIGLHPSWRSGDEPSLLLSEKKNLEQIIGKPVQRSRQHYIRFRLPQTYRSLIDLGITEEHSMGYGSVNGFRASTARPYRWFDLERNETTDLLLHPFCFMDTNSFFEQRQSAFQAENEWREMEQIVRSVSGQLITIWHNTTLGTQHRFAGWREQYSNWLRGGVN